MKSVLAIALLFILFFSAAAEVDPRLEGLRKKFPEADADKNGELTVKEATEFLHKRRGGNRDQNPKIFVPTAADLKAARSSGTVLKFPKSEIGSLRVAMTGHSWVAPGIKTLPPLAEAAGYVDHRQITHTGGGGTGSANAIWLKEFGQWQNGVAANPRLIPAISSGEWDVMTWGPYYNDKPEYYFQWIDWCLKHNPETACFLQDAWPRFSDDYRSMEHVAVAAEIAREQGVMQEKMFTPLYEAFEKSYPDKVKVIPVSAALVDLMQQFAEGKVAHLSCIDEAKRDDEVGFYRDGGHLSRSSGVEHLVGYGYFSMLYRRSPATVKGYAPKGVPPAFDEQMREAIWKAVVSSPFAGIEDTDGDGFADSAR
jgi:hypothetical protein